MTKKQTTRGETCIKSFQPASRIEARPGDIVVVTPETPHKFKNIGTERLDIICIHASPRMVQEALE